MESGTVVLSCPPTVDIDHRQIHLGGGIAVAGSLLEPLPRLAEIVSLSWNEGGEQTEPVLSVGLALPGCYLERRDVTVSYGQRSVIFRAAETAVRVSGVLPACILFGTVCGSKSVRHSGQLARPTAGVGRRKTQSKNQKHYKGLEWAGHSQPLNQPDFGELDLRGLYI